MPQVNRPHVRSLNHRRDGIADSRTLKHQKAAPFKRNDAMLDVMPRGVLVFPGTGIQDNLADKARKLGIKVWDFREYTG